jgi:WS/DGAT/MGAT family acyltransferase
MHVTSIGIFDAQGLCDRDGRLRIDAIRRRMAARLDALPRLRQRIAGVPLGLDRPTWIDDEKFDIAHHVDGVELGPGHDEHALIQLAEDVVMHPLDRRRPLWHLRFVTGLEGDRVALIERAHHAMVDGVSGVDVSMVLLDNEPDAPDMADGGWEPRPTPSSWTLLRDGLADRVTRPIDAASRMIGALATPRTVVDGMGDVASALQALRRNGVTAPSSSINRRIGPGRELVLERLRLDLVRKAGAHVGATINDVVLAAVAEGLRALFVARDEPLTPDRAVKVLVPVSVRSDAESMALGNRVGALMATLPVGIDDPEARLRAIAATTRELKASREATTTDLLMRVADLLPPSVIHLAQLGVDRQRLTNIVVTNIPGPQAPLYALGSRLLEAFPIVPIGARMTLGVAILSYDGKLTVCTTADRRACHDAHHFSDGLRRGFELLGATE